MLRPRHTFAPKLRDMPAGSITPSKSRGVISRCSGEVMAAPKSPALRNMKLRELAEGEACTVLRYGVWCDCQPETTVWAHTNTLSDNKGLGYKADDSRGFFAGHACHELIDSSKTPPEVKAALVLGGQTRTRERLQVIAETAGKEWKRKAAQWAIEQLKEQA